MKKLDVFVNEFDANAETPEFKDVAGLDADENGSDGVWELNAPTDDDVLDDEYEDACNQSENLQLLREKFDAEEPFFVQGRAGWGKTSIINDMAKRFKYNIITVYLDKAEASDIGGLPIVTKGRRGPVQHHVMPPWAQLMWDNQDKKFLLFFDEMNQAPADVQNTLMPIVKETTVCGKRFKNFFVGAAGNLEEENEAGLTGLSKPLKSRFKPLIIWKTGAKEWKSTFKHLHKKWDDKVGKTVVDTFEDCMDVYDNPREVEIQCFRWANSVTNNGFGKRYSPTQIAERLNRLVDEDIELTRTQEDKIKKCAEVLHKYMSGTANDENEDNSRSKSKKDRDMIPQDAKEMIKRCMTLGYGEQKENGKTVKYGCSRQNIGYICQSLSKEMLDRYVRKLETEGFKFKFETDDEWREKGYKDPKDD